MTIDEEKQQLRATIRRLSAQLPFRYREAADRAIARHLLALPEYRSAGAVFCFVSAGREIDTRPILEQIPCVTCSREGRRLGRGGGYYDRFLAHYRGAAVLLCRERLLRQEIPFGVHDYPIPWVLTEAGLFEDGTPSRLE